MNAHSVAPADSDGHGIEYTSQADYGVTSFTITEEGEIVLPDRP